MAAPYHRLTQTRRWISLATWLAMLLGLAIILVSIISIVRGDNRFEQMLPYLITGTSLFLLGAFLSGISQLVLKIEDNSHRMHELLIEVNSHQQKQAELLETILSNSQLSDGVKSITHRQLERDALRQAIREEIVKEDWEAAYSLIEDMENRFGYRLEAYNYRKEVDEFRANVIEDKLQASMNLARRLVQERKWVQAQAEVDRLSRLAPADNRVAEVVEELHSKRNEYKDALMGQWREAVDQKDLDRAIGLLKEIDPFLTREEAKNLEDSARDIFKAKLLDLGVQFREAVTHKRWQDAIKVGEQIYTEFPNTQMAKEVGESMEALKAKADAALAQTST